MLPLETTVPNRNFPVAVALILLANVVAFGFELALSPEDLDWVIQRFGVVPSRLTQAGEFPSRPESWLTLFSCMFLHGGWMHLLGNMWTLWLFGKSVEDRMGPFRFSIFYVLCGLAAGLIHIVTNAHSTVPTVGASGAIAGVMGAYLILFPTSRMVVVVPVFFWPFFFQLPTVAYLGFWFLLQLLSGTAALAGPEQVEGVAWWAHVGGFVAGILLYPLWTRGRAGFRRYYPDEYGLESAWMARRHP